MGAPGLAFETWDPPRKCRLTNLGALVKSCSHGGSKGRCDWFLICTGHKASSGVLSQSAPAWGICVKDPRSQKRDLGHPSSYPGGSHADSLTTAKRILQKIILRQFPQGFKAPSCAWVFAARLKRCPAYKASFRSQSEVIPRLMLQSRALSELLDATVLRFGRIAAGE